jgi:MSHA biogenesis protein MshO
VSFYTSLSVLPDTSTSATIVEFADNPVGFALQAGDFAVVYPTSDADVYDLSNNKRKEITACTDDDDGDCNTLGDDASRTANLSITGPFADFSPASRLYVARTLVSYCANSNGNIYRNQGNIAPTSFYSTGVLMAENMQNNLNEVNQAPFRLYTATLTRNSMVHILLAFERNQEIINYSHAVHCPNVP